MAHCAWTECRTWRPDLLARRGRAGLTLDGHWYCSGACVALAATARLQAGAPRPGAHRPVPIPPLKLGMLLVHHGATTPLVLQEALGAQRQSRLRLGAQLLQMGAVDREQVVRALAAQSGAPYLAAVDPALVRSVPSAIGHDAVRALGLVPFWSDAETRRVKVACAAPVPRLALRALTELTGWVADPFVVDDEAMPRLIDAYQAGLRERTAGGRSAGVSIPAAAARIAELAATGGRASVRQVTCDPFVWVRVEGADGTEDLLVHVPGRRAEHKAWQAGHTLH